MARAVRRSRSGATPSVKEIIQAGPGTALDGLALVAIGLTAWLGFWIYPAGRHWAQEALGYGWIPVGLWLFAGLVTLRYKRRVLVRYWRRWAVAAAIVAVAIGALSLFSSGDGILAESSLGGNWGSVVGGTPLPVAVLKLAGIIVLAPLLFYPAAGRVLLRDRPQTHRAGFPIHRRLPVPGQLPGSLFPGPEPAPDARQPPPAPAVPRDDWVAISDFLGGRRRGCTIWVRDGDKGGAGSMGRPGTGNTTGLGSSGAGGSKTECSSETGA